MMEQCKEKLNIAMFGQKRIPSREGGVEIVVEELCTRIKSEDFGWYPETLFEKGSVLTIDWYLEHEEWMKSVTSGNYQKYYEEMHKVKTEVE